MIQHRIELGWSVLEVVCQPKEEYLLPQMFWHYITSYHLKIVAATSRYESSGSLLFLDLED